MNRRSTSFLVAIPNPGIGTVRNVSAGCGPTTEIRLFAGFFLAHSEKNVFTRVRKPKYSPVHVREFSDMRRRNNSPVPGRKRPNPPRIHPRRPPYPNRKRPGANSGPLLAYPQFPEVKLIPSQDYFAAVLAPLFRMARASFAKTTPSSTSCLAYCGAWTPHEPSSLILAATRRAFSARSWT